LLAAFERVGFGLAPATESEAGKKLVHGERQTYCESRHINQIGGKLGSLSSSVTWIRKNEYPYFAHTSVEVRKSLGLADLPIRRLPNP
jgi:hypothetical protein